jgi:hypothetical protein
MECNRIALGTSVSLSDARCALGSVSDQAKSRHAEHCCCDGRFKGDREHRETSKQRRHSSASLGLKRTIDGRAANFEGLRDGRGAHTLRAQFLHLRRINGSLPTLIDPARLSIRNALKLALSA